ncbi:NYN domain-containing protein [Trichocoleus desertorum AS-A10]|uniref:NYN domain-containing protein n=1 Tax=Trichocoleus desertorum TaxID=1481672 RepID=UPI003297AFFD
MARSSASSTETTYLFIDGGYLKDKYNKTKQWFEGNGEIDFYKIKGYFSAKKAFYYDCLDNQRKAQESESDFSLRLFEQKQFFNSIQEVEGFHVQLGTLVGDGKKRRQKEVDILLAVDMMNHAIRGNMDKAVLLSGDRDFRPLVQSLIQMGTYVLIASDEESTAKEFIWAADSHHKITFFDLYYWSSNSLISQYPLLDRWNSNDAHELHNYSLVKKGLLKEHKVMLYKSEETFLICFPNYKNSIYNYYIKSNNLSNLETFCCLENNGNINWE